MVIDFNTAKAAIIEQRKERAMFYVYCGAAFVVVGLLIMALPKRDGDKWL